MFRNLIPRLSYKFHIVAPDLPGFGFTEVQDKYKYTFANLTNTIAKFLDAIQWHKYIIYVFDYGAPVGFRLALHRPQDIIGIISQNGNAYEEGLGDAWAPIKSYWQESTKEHRDAFRPFAEYDAIKWQYMHNVPDLSLIDPATYTLDAALTARPGNQDIQMDLFLDYQTNVKLYPEFQQYFRDNQPRLLAIWGDGDPFFIPAGANAYKRDLPQAEIRFLRTGHFALETHSSEIATAIIDFFYSK